jgi:hypothetical protein
MFVLQNAPVPTVEVNGLRLSMLDCSSETSNADLVLYMNETGGQLTAQLHYNTDLFAATTIRRMLEHFRNLLQAIVKNHDAKIASLLCGLCVA